jgi:hypothetical protein
VTVTNKQPGSVLSRRSRYWSADVLKHSNALDLQRGVFTLENPRRIAASLKRSAERSRRRKTTAYQSAMSMLNFYINRGGKTLSAFQKKKLERVKEELRVLFKKN